MIGAATFLFEQIVENSLFPRSLINSSGELVYINQAFCDLLGKNRNEDYQGKTLEEILVPYLADPAYLDQILSPLQEQNCKNHQGKIVLKTRTNRRIKLDYNLICFEFENERFFSFEWTDVTEKVEALKSLKSANERIELAADINNLGVWEYEFESQTWILNDRMYEIFGLSKNEFGGEPESFNRFFDLENLEIIYQHWNDAKAGTGKLSLELQIKHPTNGVRQIDILGKCLMDSSGNPWRFVGTISDITDEKLKEEEILLDRSRLKASIDAQNSFLIRLDSNGIITFCNKKFRKQFGIEQECKEEYKFLDVVKPECEKQILKSLNEAQNNEGVFINNRCKCTDAEGNLITIAWEFIANTHNDKSEIQGFGRDVTEELKLKEKVQEAFENIKSTINNFDKVSIWSIDKEYRVIALNEKFREEFQLYNRNTLEIGEVILDKIRPEIHEYWKNLYDDVFEYGAKQLHYEIDNHFFEVSLNPITIDNRISGIAIYGIDITENKLKEQALRESEERLQFAIEGNKFIVWETDVVNNSVWFSDSFSSIFGYPADSNFQLQGWKDSVHEDDLPEAKRIYSDLIEGRIDEFSIEFRMKDAAGNYRWVLNLGKSFEKTAEGKALRIVGLLSDITERKNNEEKVQETMEKLERFAQMTSHNLRRPLANIIGISNLMKEEVKLPEHLFDLVIEIRRSALSLDDVVREMTEAISFGKSSLSVSAPVRLKRVWFIDDDEINNMLSIRMLGRISPDSKASTYLSAEEALEAILNKKESFPDSIFLDINMPRMNGWEFLDELIVREINIPVYMLTSSIEPRDQEKAGSYEMVKDFISKPLREERLKLLMK
ncbi:MAG: PAS domain S-box protein [Bacteroidia bacterium]